MDCSPHFKATIVKLIKNKITQLYAVYKKHTMEHYLAIKRELPTDAWNSMDYTK